MAVFKIKRGDTLPVMTGTLTVESSGAAYSLAQAATVTMLAVRYVDSSGGSIAEETARSRTCTISSPSSGGIVTYTFLTTDWGSDDATKFVAGTYKVEYQVTFNSGAILTFPTDSYEEMQVLEDLD